MSVMLPGDAVGDEECQTTGSSHRSGNRISFSRISLFVSQKQSPHCGDPMALP